MQDTGGVEFVTNVRQVYPMHAFPIIFLSPTMGLDTLRTALNAGCMDVLQWCAAPPPTVPALGPGRLGAGPEHVTPALHSTTPAGRRRRPRRCVHCIARTRGGDGIRIARMHCAHAWRRRPAPVRTSAMHRARARTSPEARTSPASASRMSPGERPRE